MQDIKDLHSIISLPQSETRSRVIDNSVKIEYIIDGLLASILGIGFGNAYSVGNRSSALSFSHKVNLLIDFGYIQNTWKKKFTCFAEIRNQFAHNLEITMIENCRDENLKVLKGYVSDNNGVDFEKAYEDFYLDIQKYCNDLFSSLLNKAEKKGESLARLRFDQILDKKLEEYALKDDDFNSKLKAIWEASTIEFQDTIEDTLDKSIPIL
jgi:hypothetical protein